MSSLDAHQGGRLCRATRLAAWMWAFGLGSVDLAAAQALNPKGPPSADGSETAGAPERAENTILVLELRATPALATEAKVLTAEVAKLLGDNAAFKVLTRNELKRVAAYQEKLMYMGCEDNSCIAELSRLANAQFVCSGEVGKVGDQVALTLSLMDVASSKSVGAVTLSGRDFDDIRGRLGAAAREMLGDAATGGKKRYRLPDGKEVSFAVLELKPTGLDEATAVNLTEVLAAEVKSIDGTSVVSPADIASMLKMQETKQAFDCEDTTCLAEIGGALGVDQLIVGDVGKVGARYVISLRIVDARRPLALSRVNESFEGLESQFVAAIRHAARELLGVKSPAKGALVVEANTDDSEAKLNGEILGLLPKPTLGNFGPGKYSLLVTKSGFIDWRSDIYIAPNATTHIWAQMEEAPVKWVFWGFVGVTAAALAGGAITSGIAYAEDQQAQRMLEQQTYGYRAHLENAQSLSVAANVFWVSTGVLALGTAAAGFFTNWD